MQAKDELVGLRGRYSKVYQIRPGLNMLKLSASAQHYLSPETGEWQEINLTVKPVGTPQPFQRQPTDFEWAMTENEYHSYFRQSASDAYLVRYEARGAAIEFGVEAQQPWGKLRRVRAQKQGNRVVYPDLFPGVDLRYELSPERQLEEFVVKQPEMAQQITVIEKRFRAEGVNWQIEADGSIRFTQHGSGEELWRVPPPVMYERGGSAAAKSHGLHYELEEREGYVLLRKVVDPEGLAWLRDASRRFPMVVDDTVDLSHSALTTGSPADAGYGDGYVSQSANFADCTGLNGGYVRSDSAQTNSIGCLNSAVYRAFFEWDTTAATAIPSNAAIQAVGIYLNGTMSQQYSGQVIFKQLTDRPSSYSAPADLWNAIASATPYQSGNGFRPGNNYFNLGCRPLVGSCTSDQAIVDFANSLTQTPPVFHFGMMGGIETGINVYASYTGQPQDGSGDAGLKPDLVVFYKGAVGAYDEPNRPLRDTFWDGQRAWMLYSTSGSAGVEYAYLDATSGTWNVVGTLPDTAAKSRHYALWYDPDQNKVYVVYHAQTSTATPTPDPFVGDLRLLVGQINGTSITWNPDNWSPSYATVFDAVESSYEGYDFPSIVKDSQGYCWVASRLGTNASTISYSIRVVRSTNNNDDCHQWPGTYQTALSGSTSSVQNFVSVGGYIVPWGTGRSYVVAKDRVVPAPPATPYDPLYGVLCNSDGTCPTPNPTPAELIDSDTGQGVYVFGMSPLGINDEVHLVYIDCATDCNANEGSSLKYTFRSAGPSGTWAAPTTLINVTAVYYNPSFTRSDNTANDLYVFVRTDRKLVGQTPTPPVPHSASSAIYYKVATRSGQSRAYAWNTTDSELATGLFGLWAPLDNAGSAYSLFSNYSGKGYNYSTTPRKVIAAWVEGIFGLNAKILSPSSP